MTETEKETKNETENKVKNEMLSKTYIDTHTKIIINKENKENIDIIHSEDSKY